MVQSWVSCPVCADDEITSDCCLVSLYLLSRLSELWPAGVTLCHLYPVTCHESRDPPPPCHMSRDPPPPCHMSRDPLISMCNSNTSGLYNSSKKKKPILYQDINLLSVVSYHKIHKRHYHCSKFCSEDVRNFVIRNLLLQFQWNISFIFKSVDQFGCPNTSHHYSTVWC